MKNFENHWFEDSLIAQFQKRLRVQDVLMANDEWIADERFDSIKYLIIDLRAVEVCEYEESDFLKNAHYTRALSLWEKRKLYACFVTSNPEIERVAAKYIEISNSINPNWERKLFQSLEDALEWAEARCR